MNKVHNKLCQEQCNKQAMSLHRDCLLVSFHTPHPNSGSICGINSGAGRRWWEVEQSLSTLPQVFVDPEAILHLAPLWLSYFVTEIRQYHVSLKSLRGGMHVKYTLKTVINLITKKYIVYTNVALSFFS